VLDTDRQTHHVHTDAGFGQLNRVELAVRGQKLETVTAILSPMTRQVNGCSAS
jgi:hypothetical protein